MNDHFATQYIGRKWVAFGRGPKAYDCWGLVMEILAVHYGIIIGDTVVDGSNTRARVRAFLNARETQMADWLEVQYPGDGDVVLMSNKHDVPTHCGIYLSAMGGGILHCEEGVGVIFTKATDTRWPRLAYYRYKK